MSPLFALVRPLVARLGLGAVALVPGGGFVAAAASLSSALVSFLSTRFGRRVGLALIGAALYVMGDVHRAALDRADYRAKWSAALQQAEAARALRDEAIKRAVAADADRRIADIQRESEQLQTRVADYEQALSRANAVACRATADDARRLRQLWSAAGRAAR
jgi:hypothetical protein